MSIPSDTQHPYHLLYRRCRGNWTANNVCECDAGEERRVIGKAIIFPIFPHPSLKILAVCIKENLTRLTFLLYLQVENMVSERALRQSIWSQNQNFPPSAPTMGGGGGGGGGLTEILYICFSQLSFKRRKKFHPG